MIILGFFIAFFVPVICFVYRAYHWLRYGENPELTLNGFEQTIAVNTDWEGVLVLVENMNNTPIEVFLVVIGFLTMLIDE
jgi:hypothetical protein